MSDSSWFQGLYSPWNFLGQNTGVGSLSLLQEIFPTQGSNPCLPHCRKILYQLSHKGSPVKTMGTITLARVGVPTPWKLVPAEREKTLIVHYTVYWIVMKEMVTHQRLNKMLLEKTWGFPGGASGEEPGCQCRRHETWVWSLGCKDPLAEGLATHSSILAWRIPWAEEPGGLQSIASQRERGNGLCGTTSSWP